MKEVKATNSRKVVVPLAAQASRPAAQCQRSGSGGSEDRANEYRIVGTFHGLNPHFPVICSPDSHGRCLVPDPPMRKRRK
jgi:hypothetical protein